MKSKNYGDSLILISKYYFSKTGLLIQVDSYDVYGKMNRAFYENDSLGYLSRILFISDKGDKTVKEINFEKEQIVAKDHAIDTTFDSLNRPIKIVEHQNGDEVTRTLYRYQRRKTTLTTMKGEKVLETRLRKYSRSRLLVKDVMDRRISIKHIPKKGYVHTRPLRYSKKTFKYDGQRYKQNS